jgi:hypothetical protein
LKPPPSFNREQKMSDDEIITTKEAVKALVKECGGYKAVANEFDVSLARLYTFTDEAFPDHNISYKRVAQMTQRHGASAAARDLAQRAGGFFCPLPEAKDAPAMTLTADAVREHAEAVAKAMMAHADGKVTDDERTDVVKEIDEAICALASLRASFVKGGGQ